METIQVDFFFFLLFSRGKEREEKTKRREKDLFFSLTKILTGRQSISIKEGKWWGEEEGGGGTRIFRSVTDVIKWHVLQL